METEMSSDERFLKELINRITNHNSDTSVELATEMVCSLVKENTDLIKKCTELLKSKIQSKNEKEVLKALDLLAECMSECGPIFQRRIARNQFLNELARLVSEKHKGLETPKEIRHKIMNLLLLWTTLYPDMEKIKEMYEALSKDGGVQHEQSIPVSGKCAMKQSILMSNEEEKILKQLLQSKEKNDIKKANLLIKFFVDRDAKQNEKKGLINGKLQEIKALINLLNQVIDRWTVESPQTRSEANLNLMKELCDMCNRYKPELDIMPHIIDEREERTLADAIEVNDSLLEVLNKCKEIISNGESVQSEVESNEEINPEIQTVATPDDLLSDLLGESCPSTSRSSENPMDELKEIFINIPEQPNYVQDKYNFTKLQLLEPTLLETSGKNVVKGENVDKNNPAKTLNDIDKISEDLLKANIKNGQLIRDFKKEPKKVSLNELAKEKPVQTERNTSSENQSAAIPGEQLTTFDKLINEVSNVDPIISVEDNLAKELKTKNITKETPIISVEENLVEELKAKDITKEETLEKLAGFADCEKRQNECIRHLSEITMNLSDIEVAKEAPRKLMYNPDLQVTVHFALNKPSLHVGVFVISTINQNHLPLANYHLIASVRRPCKVRTLSPTSTNLPGVEPLKLPTVDIRQILLLYNPTEKPVDITFIIEYTLGNDPDPIKESIIVKDVPYCFE